LRFSSFREGIFRTRRPFWFAFFVVFIQFALSGHGHCQLPSPWQEQDIGSPGATGSAAYDSGSDQWTVQGAGADIWGSSDKFHFVYKAWTGDGEVITRVASQGTGNDWAKAGIMFRETLDADSRFTMIAVTPVNGLVYQHRLQTGQNGYSTGLLVAQAPYWVRMIRQGDTFRAYASASGSEWILLAEKVVPMEQSLYVGIAVTSHDQGVLNQAVFEFLFQPKVRL